MIATIARQGTGLARLSVFLCAGRFVTLAAPVNRLDFEGIRIMQRLLPILLAGVCLASVSAQTATDRPSPGGTRVAVVDIGYLLYHHPRANSTGRGELPPPQTQEARQLQTEIKNLEAALRDGDLDNAKQAEYEKRLAAATMRREQLGREVKALVAKKQEDHLVEIWRDMNDAIKAYSTEHHVDIVLGYGEPDERELLREPFPNINRKLQAMDLGSSVLLFSANHADITEPVFRLILEQRRKKLAEQSK
jgi:Skp family chaperone for outer membrane proteins